MLPLTVETCPKPPADSFPSKQSNKLYHLLKDSTSKMKAKAISQGSQSKKEQQRKPKWASKSVLPYGTRHEGRTGTHTLVQLQGQRNYSQNLSYNTLQEDNVPKWWILVYAGLTLVVTFRWQWQKAITDTTWKWGEAILFLCHASDYRRGCLTPSSLLPDTKSCTFDRGWRCISPLAWRTCWDENPPSSLHWQSFFQCMKFVTLKVPCFTVAKNRDVLCY